MSMFRPQRIRVTHARALILASNASAKLFQGVWVMSAGRLRSIGLKICDSRDQFLGHVDAWFPTPPPVDNEPPDDPLVVIQQTQISDLLKQHHKFIKDPDPAAAAWMSSEIDAVPL